MGGQIHDTGPAAQILLNSTIGVFIMKVPIDVANPIPKVAFTVSSREVFIVATLKVRFVLTIGCSQRSIFQLLQFHS